MNISFFPSPNFTKKRNRKIKFLIIHYTGMKTIAESIKRLQDVKQKVSAHYLLDYDGSIIQMVKDKNIAWHAGLSYWDGKKNLNNNSIGIEIQNKGEEFGYERFGQSQISSLITLIQFLKSKYSIKDFFIIGHSDIAPDRKIDPGYLFPWQRLFKVGIGLMPRNIKSMNKELPNSKIKDLQRLLKKFGYKLSISGILNLETLQVLYAFQSHYCPNELKEFPIKSKLLRYLEDLIRLKNRSLTKQT